MPRIVLPLSLLVIAGLGAAAYLFTGSDVGAEELPTIEIKEWNVPYEKSRPRDPYAASRETVWFVGQKTGYLAKLNVPTGEFTKIDLKDESRPHNLIVGSDDNIWYAGNKTALIGIYNPSSEEITEVAMPDGTPRDPHTLIEDTKGQIWFTAQGANYVGRLRMTDKSLELVDTSEFGTRPYGINIAPNGDAWVVMFGSNALVQFDAATMATTHISLPHKKTRPRRLEITSDGRIWYGDYSRGFLGMYDPATDTHKEFLMPDGEKSRPYGMEIDSQDRIWVVATGPQPNNFIGFDTTSEEFISSTPVPSGGKTLRHMHYHEESGTVWFGADTNTIGRAVVEPEKFNVDGN